MRKSSLIILLVLISISCKNDQAVESDLKSPYELWKSKNIHNYSIDQIRFCFCPDAGQLVRITVRSDTIQNIIRLSDDNKITYPFYYTIDSLFGIINKSKNDSLVIRYNSLYDYPEYLDINPQLHPVDGGVLYETSNLHAE